MDLLHVLHHGLDVVVDVDEPTGQQIGFAAGQEED